MANSTANYNLLKPLKTEKADIQIINNNMDKIDAAMKSISQTVTSNASHNHDDRYYTEAEVDDKLFRKANVNDIPKKVSELSNDSNYVTDNGMKSYAQPIGDYAINSSLSTVALSIPSKTSQLINDNDFVSLENGKIPSTVLPGSVDDVVEGYLNDGKFYKENTYATEIVGESSKIYVDIDTNKTYRWSGNSNIFVVISETISLGQTSSTAYRGDRGKIAYDHSQSTHARTDATKVESSSTNGNIKINETETKVYTHPGSGTNPHGTTKSDVGLGNVPNVSTNDQTPTFTQATTRANIVSGEKLSVMLGKMMKWFTDLKTVSFSGSFNDLIDIPTIPSKVSELENDTGFITAATSDVAYNLGVSLNNATNGNVKIKLASASDYDEIPIKGTGSVTVETDSDGAIIINSNSNSDSSGTVIVYSPTEPTDANNGSIWIE